MTNVIAKSLSLVEPLDTGTSDPVRPWRECSLSRSGVDTFEIFKKCLSGVENLWQNGLQSFFESNKYEILSFPRRAKRENEFLKKKFHPRE